MTPRDILFERLIDQEQARFVERRPRSQAAGVHGRRHFLYGAPSHWMRRWAGGFPIYVDSARGATIRDIDVHTAAFACFVKKLAAAGGLER
jgi:glutamate-1-semialdehyde 2,1-aminomutase